MGIVSFPTILSGSSTVILLKDGSSARPITSRKPCDATRNTSNWKMTSTLGHPGRGWSYKQ